MVCSGKPDSWVATANNWSLCFGSKLLQWIEWNELLRNDSMEKEISELLLHSDIQSYIFEPEYREEELHHILKHKQHNIGLFP